MNRTRVYAPETNEPFDVTASKAADLVLLKGWTQTPVERTVVAEPSQPEAEEIADVSAEADALDDAEDTATWRSGRARTRGRKTFGSEDATV